jgi:hypothetical protein
MKTIQLLCGVIHVPGATWVATMSDIAGISVTEGSREIRVVHPGEKIELSDAESERLIARGVAIEVESP